MFTSTNTSMDSSSFIHNSLVEKYMSEMNKELDDGSGSSEEKGDDGHAGPPPVPKNSTVLALCLK